MARKQQDIRVSNSFEYTVSAPADARLLVDVKEDLYDAASFPFPYVGMMVGTKTGKAYILKALPTTVEANWLEIGADIDTSVIEAEVAKKAEGYIETVTATVNVGDDRPLVENEIIKVKSSDGTKEYQGVVDATGTATIDVEGNQVTIAYDSGNSQLTLSNPGSADIDSTKVEITTEIVHKIDSRLLPKSGSVDTQDYIDEALTVKEDQGKYKKGDIIPKNTALLDIVKNMLLKTNNPTVSEPKVTLSGTGDKLLESGATLNATMTATFDRGAVTPVYYGVQWRAGEATAYSLNGGGEQAENTFSVVVSESNKEFTAVAKYAAGEEIKNDEGNKYMDALGAGSVTSNTVKYDFVDAIYSNEANINVVAKLPLVAKSAGQKVFNFPAAPDGTKETFDIPKAWTVIAVEVENELSGRFEQVSEFVTSDIKHPNSAGVDVDYVRYEDGRGFASGPRKVRVRWS